jgi:nitroreductase
MKKIMNNPALGDILPSAHPSTEMLEALRLRRSAPADLLGEPGPDEETLSSILTIAARVPDHRRVTPFRFIVFQGEARARFGETLARAFVQNEPDAEEKRIECEGNRLTRAPVVIAVISAVNKSHRTPEWEQILSAGAVCQNLLLGASASGFAAQWLTEWYAYDADVLAGLGLEDNERVAGFVYIGTARENPKERARPDIEAITTYY